MPNKTAVDLLVTEMALAGTPGGASATLTGTVSANQLDRVIQAVRATGGSVSLAAGVFTIQYQQ